jgi:hypothetical protein
MSATRFDGNHRVSVPERMLRKMGEMLDRIVDRRPRRGQHSACQMSETIIPRF